MEQEKKETRKTDQYLFVFTSRGQKDRIETSLFRHSDGQLSLRCRRIYPDGEEAVCIRDPGRDDETCLAFARAVAESHTHPRVLLELWEEFAP